MAIKQPTLNEMYQSCKKNGKTKICRFMRDMRRAGLKMYYYRGRYYWSGPAVDCDNLQTVLSNTKVPCQWDNMGLGFVVYPKECYDVSRQIFGD